jgi:hypothetical protein
MVLRRPSIRPRYVNARGPGAACRRRGEAAQWPPYAALRVAPAQFARFRVAASSEPRLPGLLVKCCQPSIEGGWQLGYLDPGTPQSVDGHVAISSGRKCIPE